MSQINNTFLLKYGGTMNGDIDVGGNNTGSVAVLVNPRDVVTKNYVTIYSWPIGGKSLNNGSVTG